MRAAVVGHVEWIRFARVERVPASGEIAHSSDAWEEAGGGGGVAALQLALLADESHLFTALGVEVTAEGIETEAQRDTLIRIGCDELQGFLLSRPMSLEQVDERLAVTRETDGSAVASAA